MISRSLSCASALRSGAKMKPMPPPDIPPSIQKPQKSSPKAASHLRDQRLGVVVGGPRDDRLDRPAEIAGGRLAERPDVALPERLDHLVEHPQRILPPVPFLLAAQQVLLGHHLEDRPDVLGHAAVHQDQRIQQRLPRRLGHLVAVEDPVARHQAPAADAELRIALARRHPADQLDPRPDAAGILPAAARAAEPLAEQRPREHDPAFVLLQRAGQRRAWPVARMHAAISEPSRFVETASRDPFGMSLTQRDDLQPESRARPSAPAGRPARRPSPRSRAARSRRRSPPP